VASSVLPARPSWPSWRGEVRGGSVPGRGLLSLAGLAVRSAVALSGLALLCVGSSLLPVYSAVVLGGSMEPVLASGDLLILVETSADSVEMGDIVGFRQGDKGIIHRVVDIDRSGELTRFVTKGDANGRPDGSPVLPGQLEGRLLFSIPKLGWIRLLGAGQGASVVAAR